MNSSLALRFLLLSSSSSSESGCTHGKCSMPDFVNLGEKLYRCYILFAKNLGSRRDHLKRKHSPVPKYLILIPLSSIWFRSPQLVEQKAPKTFGGKFSRYLLTLLTSWSVVLIKRKLGSHFSTLLKTDDLRYVVYKWIYIFLKRAKMVEICVTLCKRLSARCHAGHLNMLREVLLIKLKSQIKTWIGREKSCWSNRDDRLKPT